MRLKYNMLFQSKSSGARAIVEIQVILASYLKIKKRMHAVYRIERGDFDGVGTQGGTGAAAYRAHEDGTRVLSDDLVDGAPVPPDYTQMEYIRNPGAAD